MENSNQSVYSEIPLEKITPDPDQPRKDFEEERIEELMANIKVNGVIQPIIVRRLTEDQRPNPDIEFMIISGERRYQSCVQLQFETIKAIIQNDVDENIIFTYQLSENLHRQDLNPIEKAEFLHKRIEFLKSKGKKNAVEEVAKELGVSVAWVSQNTAPLRYADDVREVARVGLLRDYGLLNKIDKLNGKKRERAIQLIKAGTFDKKEFFSRKRYDKPKVKEEQSNEPVDKKTADKKATIKPINLKLTPSDFYTLIKKTDYCHILDNAQPNWDKPEHLDKAHDFVKPFQEWLFDTHEKEDLHSP